MNKVFSLLFIVCIFSCDKKEKEIETYTGPVVKAYDIYTNYTEVGSPKMKLQTPEQLEFVEGDKEFPKGIFLQFYKESYGEAPYGDLVADFAHYYSGPKHWLLKGNVIYRDIEDSETIKSEEMYWSPKTHKLWSDVFVHITAPGKELMGDGLDALDDFSWYKIKKPRGRKQNM